MARSPGMAAALVRASRDARPPLSTLRAEYGSRLTRVVLPPGLSAIRPRGFVDTQQALAASASCFVEYQSVVIPRICRSCRTRRSCSPKARTGEVPARRRAHSRAEFALPCWRIAAALREFAPEREKKNFRAVRPSRGGETPIPPSVGTPCRPTLHMPRHPLTPLALRSVFTRRHGCPCRSGRRHVAPEGEAPPLAAVGEVDRLGRAREHQPRPP